MTQWAEQHMPCPCGKSSDAYAVDATDGHGFCFSCGKSFYDTEAGYNETTTTEYVSRRGISKQTHEFFGVIAQINGEGQPVSVLYPYGEVSKRKTLLYKGFSWTGDPEARKSVKGGWPRDKFTPGQARAITITEGEDDAMSTYEMLGGYPVYSIRSSATALSDVRADFDYLNSFGKIYLALDNDDAGRKATAAIASCFDTRKVYFVNLHPFKDATDYSENDKLSEFKSAWFNAKRYVPEGVVSSFSDIDAILDSATNDPGHSWPFPDLNILTDGIKPARSYLFSGLEGIGKTEFFHAVEYHLAITDPEANIAILHLEEPTDENIKKLVGYHLKVPTLYSDSGVPKEEIKHQYRAIAGREDRIHFYNHFGSDDPDILLSKVRYFVAVCGCKYVFFDNITVSVSGLKEDDERKMLDYLSTQLEMMVKELKFTLFVISHENDFGLTRGSRNISKVFDVWINAQRNISEGDNKLYLKLNKGRGCRGTGPAGILEYNTLTSVLEPYQPTSQNLPTE